MKMKIFPPSSYSLNPRNSIYTQGWKAEGQTGSEIKHVMKTGTNECERERERKSWIQIEWNRRKKYYL